MKIAAFLFVAFSMVTGGSCNTCPLEDISYGDHGNWIAQFYPIETWQECGKICHTLHQPDVCEFWTWNPYNQDCGLYANDDGIMVKEGRYSGDTNCYTTFQKNNSISA